VNRTRGGNAGPPPGAGSPGGGYASGQGPGGGDRGNGDRSRPARQTPRGVTVAGYLALCLLGALLGLIGTFQYSQGPAPLAAILFDLAILVTCVLGSIGMRSALGGVLPAAGWFVVTMILSSSSAGGTVLVTDTTAGKWFLFGGAVCAAAGGVYAFAAWSKPSREHRARQSSGPGGEPGLGPHEDRPRQGSGSARTPRRPGR
jgi:drug/metabolite transporter (DMT)-like permease